MTTATKLQSANPGGQEAPPQIGVRPMTLAELEAKIARGDYFAFVMAMDQRRWETAHIAGSISFDTLRDGLSPLDRSVEIVVYCTDAACAASKLRAAQLVEQGFTNVYRFAGGLTEWEAAGLPIVERAGS